MTSRRPPATPDELLASLPDVHPSMVPAYLAEATVRVLVEIRNELRQLAADIRGDLPDDDDQAAAVPAQRAGDRGPSMAEQSAAGVMTRQQRRAWQEQQT